MSEPESKSLDILGTKPIADAALHITKVTTDGAASFLARICMPAAEEYGLLLRDKVKVWRAKNAAAVLAEAERRLEKHQPGAKTFALPRIVNAALENGSWTDDDVVQGMWGGLLASSCTPSGGSETNLIFTGLLSRMTSTQARLLNYACEGTTKSLGVGGLIFTGGEAFMVEADPLLAIAGLADVHQLDVELDHLRELGLITAGFSAFEDSGPLVANMTVTALALNLYVRSQGYIGAAGDYFGLTKPTPDNAS